MSIESFQNEDLGEHLLSMDVIAGYRNQQEALKTSTSIRGKNLNLANQDFSKSLKGSEKTKVLSSSMKRLH